MTDAAGCWFCPPRPGALPGLDCQASVGVDVRIANFATTSDGQHVPNPGWGRVAATRLGTAQQVLARKQRGSRPPRKARATVATRYRKLANQRRNFTPQRTAGARRPLWPAGRRGPEGPQPCAADRTPPRSQPAGPVPGLGAAAKTGLHRSIHDAGWPDVSIRIAEEAGRVVIDVDPRHTSDRCEACGHTAEEPRHTSSVLLSRLQAHRQRRRACRAQHPPGWTGPSRSRPRLHVRRKAGSNNRQRSHQSVPTAQISPASSRRRTAGRDGAASRRRPRRWPGRTRRRGRGTPAGRPPRARARHRPGGCRRPTGRPAGRRGGGCGRPARSSSRGSGKATAWPGSSRSATLAGAAVPAVAPEQPDRHPGSRARGQPGRHRDQDAQVVTAGDERVGRIRSAGTTPARRPPITGPPGPARRTPPGRPAQPVRTSADPKRNTSIAWAAGRSASKASSTEP